MIPTAWVVSMIALWVLVFIETGLLLLLLRALGQLQQQGKLSSASLEQRSGLETGEQAPSFTAADHDRNTIRLDDFRGRRCIIAFVSPGCSACGGAIEALNMVEREDHDLALLVIGDSDARQNHTYAIEHKAQMPIWAAAPSLALDIYRIPGFPFVYVLDEEHSIRAKGAVNRYEHLQALLETAFGQVAGSR